MALTSFPIFISFSRAAPVLASKLRKALFHLGFSLNAHNMHSLIFLAVSTLTQKTPNFGGFLLVKLLEFFNFQLSKTTGQN